MVEALTLVGETSSGSISSSFVHGCNGLQRRLETLEGFFGSKDSPRNLGILKDSNSYDFFLCRLFDS